MRDNPLELHYQTEKGNYIIIYYRLECMTGSGATAIYSEILEDYEIEYSNQIEDHQDEELTKILQLIDNYEEITEYIASNIKVQVKKLRSIKV